MVQDRAILTMADQERQINVKNAVYRYVNGKIAQRKQQIPQLGF